MVSLKYLFRKFIQWAAGVFYEGPMPPERLVKSVAAFSFTHPVASREEWSQAMLDFGEQCWQEGYQRGYEQRVEDITAALGTVVVPKKDHVAQFETATPHRLDTEEHIAETVELRSVSGKVAKVTLDEALAPNPELRRAEEEYWRERASIGPKR